MPDYIVSGRNKAEKTITRIIRTALAQDALDIMESDGFTGLVLHTDEVAAAKLQSYQPKRKISAAELLKQSRLTAFGKLWRILPRVALFWSLTVLVLTATWFILPAVFSADPKPNLELGLFYGTIIWIPVLILLLFNWYRSLYRLERMLNAVALARWNKLLRLTKWQGALPAPEVAFVRALALSGNGKLGEALEHLERHADNPKQRPWLYWTRRADVFSYAGFHDEAIASLREAMSLSPLNPTIMLLLATRVLRGNGTVAEGKKLFAAAMDNPIAENIRYLASSVEGSIAHRENNLHRACELFRRAIDDLKFRPPDPLIQLIDAGIRGQLAIAYAKLGEAEHAAKEFGKAEPMLRLHRFFESTIQAYHEAIAGK